ncbi:MAG: hypothetical protein ACM3MA_01135 [Acidobacteriota bacterium]
MAEVEGKLVAGFAHCCDTVLFAYNKLRNTCRQVTDEQFDNNRRDVVLNGMGPRDGWQAVGDQVATFDFEDGDILMLCSDGITGDKDADRLSADDIRGAFFAFDASRNCRCIYDD